MNGLIRKDLYVADKTGRLLMVLALVLSLVPSLGSFGSTYAMMMALMIPLNAIAYDEKCKWDRYAAMLPYKVGQLVWSKYLLAYLFTLLAGGIIVLGGVLRGVITGSAVNWGETLEMTLMLGVSMLFVTALGLPALYRFGSEKGRFIMILILGVGIGISVGLMEIFEEVPKLPSLPLPVVAAAIALLAAAATCGSFRLSVHFYKRRLNGNYN